MIDCLRSIFSFSREIEQEIIVVDNASGDNSRELITTAFPSVVWIQMNYNAGFARANNEGIRKSRGEIVLLLNSDTIIKENSLQKAYLSLRDSSFVACGVQLLNEDGSPQISGNYVMKGGLNHLLPIPYIGALVKLAGNLFNVKKPNIPEAKDLVEVDWINGAFLMVKKSAIETAGLMDEDFFLYAEESEWCSRLKKAGSLCIYGQYHVIHLQGATTGETFGSIAKGYADLTDKKGLQIMLSNFVRIRKQFGVGWFVFHMLAYVMSVPIYFIVGLIHHLFTFRKFSRFADQFAGFALNVVRLLGFVPAIISNKPYFYKVL